MGRTPCRYTPLGLSDTACRLLAPEALPLQPPIRAVLFGAARFSEHGRSLARAQEIAAPGEARGSFFPRLQENLEVLRDSRRLLEAHARQGHHLAPAAGWLIDNGALLEQQLDTVREGLPRRYFEKLPRLRDDTLAGLPRIYGLAWAWVAHTDSGLDEDLLELFLGAYQSQRELTLAELWAIPTTLRVVLVENLRRLAERAATVQAARDAAHRWIDRLPQPGTDAASPPGLLDTLTAALASRGALEAFALQLQRRSEEWSDTVAPELRAWLSQYLPDPAGALQRQQQQEAEDHQSVRNAVLALRGLDCADWRGLLMRSSAALVDLLALRVFAAEAEATQDLALRAIESLARRAGRPESEVSAAVARLVRSVDSSAPGPGADPAVPEARADAAPLHWLRGPGRPTLQQSLGLTSPWAALRLWARPGLTPAYLVTVGLTTVGLVAWVLHHDLAGAQPAWAIGLTALLLAWPTSEAVVAAVHRLLSESLPPRRLARLALAAGIPASQRTLVVMPVMLSSVAAIREGAAQLEQHHLANPEPNAQFALLSDPVDAATQHEPGDAALLQAAQDALESLNRRHPVDPGVPLRFLLLHRGRRWSDSEQCWMGWERKRGKLEALLAHLAEPDAAALPFHDLQALSQPAPAVRSVLTLDSDTDMPPGRLRELVAIAAHPLNRPVIDPGTRRITTGYGILQPRLAVPLPRPGASTAFHWLFSGQWGVDPYSVASSEVYQDLFDEGTYTGKGLLDVQAVHAVLKGRLPDAQVLSHDLLEGSLARCAAVSDVTLVEDAPFHPDVAASRLHRWTRGDWQLLPFLVHPRRWPMAGINRWKMFDNLRRSLVAPMALALLLWALVSDALPVADALWVVLAAYGAGPWLGAVAALAPPRDDIGLRLFFGRAATELLRALLGAAWALLQLPAQALLALDAIGRALVRQFRSRRHLLEWTTAAAAKAQAHTALPELLWRHRAVPLLAAALALGLLGLQAAGAPVNLAAGLPLCLLWALAPVAVWLASRPLPSPDERLDAVGLERVQALAADTWVYYERYVGPEDHHLPPDNVQMTGPEPMVAHRTSPTNIGLYLLVVMAARELGFIGVPEAVRRLEATLGTLDQLPRWRGHFYNWIDTQSLVTLVPAYVSAVDSGNLCGHLLVLAGACETLAAQTPDAWERAPVDRAAVAGEDAAALCERLCQLAVHARMLALAADFRVLYDKRRHLLHIGYDVEHDRLDAGHYDLLASEARLASLVGIAKGDLPPRHWSALGRPLFAADGVGGRGVGLKSWSGSMFEYLMPSLVLAEPAGSLLHQAVCTAVAAQRADAARRGLPWGVSESAIAVQDHTHAYQYGPQGVASLAMRRTPAEERVVAPYATVMALLVAPQAAADNLARLQALGARRPLGFIESMDYTPYRQPADALVASAAEKRPAAAYTPVETFMAHHQAMGLLACAHVLAGGAVQRWAAASPHLRAVLPLLHEPAPAVAPRLRVDPELPRQGAVPGQRWQFQSQPQRTPLPPTHLLGNERYAVALRANGAGCSLWQGQGLSRWRDDALRDIHGLFAYVRRAPETRWVSLSSHPASESGSAGDRIDPQGEGGPAYTAEFHPDRVVLRMRLSDLSASTTVSVSTVDDCEVRRIELTNPGRRPLRLSLAVAFEPTLAAPAADETHPAFSNLFLQARWSPAERALFLQRRPRLAHEPSLHAVLFLAACDDPQARVGACAERAQWLGRLGDPADPVGPGPTPVPVDRLGDDGAAEWELPTGLDPMAVIHVDLTLPPRGSRTLSFVLGAAADADALRALVDRWQQPASVERALGLSDTLARIRLRELRLDVESWTAWLHLNTLLVSLSTRPLLASAEAIDRRVLWRHGIGGARPILAVWIESPEGLELARQLAGMLTLWTAAGQALDLVIVNGEPASYAAPLQQAFAALAEQAALRVAPHLPAERRSALKLLHARDLQPAEQATLRMLARVNLQADGRSLVQHLERLRTLAEEDQAERRRVPRHAIVVQHPDPAATMPSGRFEPPSAGVDAAAFRFELSFMRCPSRPWSNVLANPEFGCLLTESAGGNTWAGNSRMHQITGFANDPLCDPPAEALHLEDLDSHRVWWLGRSLASASREVVHGIGSTRMRQQIDGLDIELVWCVDASTAVKQLQVRLALLPGPAGLGGAEAKPRRLRLVGYAEWTLGAARADRVTVVTRSHRWLIATPGAPVEQGVGLAVLATQRDASGGHGGATAFLCWRPGPPVGARGGDAAQAWPDLDDWTCDRREFHDGTGRRVLPSRLRGRAGAGLDPCGAVACRAEVAAGRPVEVTLLLGHADSADGATRLAQDACAVRPAERLATQQAQWPVLLDAMVVATPDPLFDALVNRWLPYQAIACRLWARSGYYQAGGAFGFRDQLQDAMNLADRAPQLLLQQLRLHASRQFEAGDVQHWWHPPGGAGVRTKMTDDLLWLPLALAHALQHGATASLLDERVPFLRGAAVPADREDLYETPTASEEEGSLYEHGARAIDLSLATLAHSAHGLPLMGTGDWNDGMNRVGDQGKGESVWLGWFVCEVIEAYAPWAERRALALSEREPAAAAALKAQAQRWRDARRSLAQALDRDGWDGRWYRRAYFDDGTPLGSAGRAECRIDLIAQAWAVLSRAGDPARASQAMASARELLWDPRHRLMKLLDPPLAEAVPEAGYIQAYPPGIRENGGQYSHGAVWALMACAAQGDADWTWRLFEGLSPAHRGVDPQAGPRYALEPYVMAGDIYSQPPYAGRGGWSWYTGAASWLQRAALESICGVQLEGSFLMLCPCLPPHWPQAEITLRRSVGPGTGGLRTWRITLLRDEVRWRTLQDAGTDIEPVRGLLTHERVALDHVPDGTRLVVLLPTD